MYKKYQKQYEYLLDCIESDEEELTTPQQKLEYFAERFHSEYDYEFNRREYPNLQERISEYLKGLPIHIAYENYNIGLIGKEWGIVNDSKQEARFVNNWFSVCAFRLIQLCEHYKIALVR